MMDDVGNYLRALVTYTDGQSNDVTPVTAIEDCRRVVSTNVVRRGSTTPTLRLRSSLDQDPETEWIPHMYPEHRMRLQVESVAEDLMPSGSNDRRAPVAAVDLDVNSRSAAGAHLQQLVSGD